MNQPIKLLLVDDTPTNLALLIDYLTKSNFQLFVAESGRSALERLQHLQPDLILLDVRMPGMSGFEVCKAIKANPQTCHIPVIFLTGREETADKLKGFAVGGVDYITKPLAEAEVLARVHTHLQLAQFQRQLSTENNALRQQLARRPADPSQPLSTAIVQPIRDNALLQLTLFGSFQLVVNGQVRDAFRSDLVRGLLAYLVLEGQIPHDRAELAEFCWPTYLPHTRLNSLRVALHNLRQLLTPFEHLLVTDRKTVRFHADAPQVWCDALALERGSNPASLSVTHPTVNGLPMAKSGFLRGLNDVDSNHFQQWRQSREKSYTAHLRPSDKF